MKKNTEANLAIIASKTFSGLNMNALKYLLPVWLSPLSGVALRCLFAAVCFWITGLFLPREKSGPHDKWYSFLLGVFAIFGYMFSYQVGLSKTTPVSGSIFISLQPIWVFLIAVLFFHEKMTVLKITGILVGLGGALLCVSTQKSSDLASDPLVGNLLCIVSSILYALYLIFSQRLLKGIGMMTLLKYSFTGAAFSALVMTAFTGLNAPVFSHPLHWTPLLVLLFVLIFPTVISYLLLPFSLKYLNATVIAMYGYLVLLVTTVVALLIGQDRFSWTQMTSLLLICIGVYLVEIAEDRHNLRKKQPSPRN